MNKHFKTRVCLKYFENGYCPYGIRCQYLHKDVYYLDQYQSFINKLFSKKNLSSTRINNLTNYSIKLANMKSDQVLLCSDN